MKIRTVLALAFLISTSVLSGKAAAEGEGVLSSLGFEFSGDVNYSTKYIWRGIRLDGDPVIQPGFYLKTPESKFGRVKLGYWFSRDLVNDDLLKSSETDYIAEYDYSFPLVDVAIGHTYYDFPDAVPSDGAPKGFSREVYAGMAFPKLPLSPSIYYYWDYGKKEDGGGEGSYTVLNLAYSLPVKLYKYACSVDFSGHAGLNNKQYYRGKGGDAAIGVGLTIPLAKNFTMKPNINYSVPWGNVSDKGNGNQKNEFYNGIYFAYAF